MHIYTKQVGEVLVVKLCGRLYRDTARRFEEEMHRHLTKSATKIVLDLENLHAINSAGLRTLHLVSRHIEDNHGHIAFCAGHGEILDCIGCAGLCTCCHVHGTLEDALASIKQD